VISNYSASIFLQKPHETILPLTFTEEKDIPADHLDYALEQPYSEIVDYVSKLTLKTQIFQLLLESLRAENGARALAMDSSTRNAKNLLTEMKLVYNKLRQAKVTKELTELSSSLIE
jgi:F-type H+-transporting ATPase subunit gamma